MKVVWNNPSGRRRARSQPIIRCTVTCLPDFIYLNHNMYIYIYVYMSEFREIRGAILGAPIRRTMVFWGLC